MKPRREAESEAKQDLPMSVVDYLLSHLAQECNEVAIRCTKAQMFGLDEVQPGQEFTNRERITQELCDVLAMCDVLRDEGVMADVILASRALPYLERKKAKAAKFSDYSRELGRLAPVSNEVSNSDSRTDSARP